MPIFVPFMLNMGVTPVPAHAPLRTARSCGAQRTVATMPRRQRSAGCRGGLRVLCTADTKGHRTRVRSYRGASTANGRRPW